MILYQDKIYENADQTRLISSLQKDMLHTLATQKHPEIETVIRACDKLYQRVMNHEFDAIALPLLRAMNMPYSSLEHYAAYFSKAGLEKKVEVELGDLAKGELPLDEENVRYFEPLGILFHIAAGNVDLLPAYSVIEGLLVGNINILKLPSGDNGLSVLLLKQRRNLLLWQDLYQGTQQGTLPRPAMLLSKASDALLTTI